MNIERKRISKTFGSVYVVNFKFKTSLKSDLTTDGGQ